MKKYILQILPALFILVAISVQAQNKSIIEIPINVNLVKGINLNTIKGDLNFGELMASQVSSKTIKNPSDGVLIEVVGQPGRNVIVEYSNSPLINTKKKNSQLNFTPKCEASESNSYTQIKQINSSSSLTLNNDRGLGKKYIWIGGEIEVAKNSTDGDYQGVLTLTVSY